MLPLLVVVALIATVIVLIEQHYDGGTPIGVVTGVEPGEMAPEVVGIEHWINSAPLKLSDLKGKVVLVDFWTYTCVNCIRTFPYLKDWHAKYADAGLVILGVHSPEFTFEKKLDNVRNAVEREDLGWPVAMDNDHATWGAFRNRFWPAKYLIDKDGILRYKHFGEGAYGETESKIRGLLEEVGADLARLDSGLPNGDADVGASTNLFGRLTRELYGGWQRGYSDSLYGGGGFVAHQEYYQARDQLINYEDPGDHQEGRLYLQGTWHNGRESLKHGRETSVYDDYIALRFSARSVNAVINPGEEDFEPFKVLVTLNGQNFTEPFKGDDVIIEADGRSFLYVDAPRMYSIVQAPEFATYELKLSSNSTNFAVFAFTFGVREGV